MKKILGLLLACILIIATFTSTVLAATDVSNYAGIGNAIVEVLADGDTSEAPSDFAKSYKDITPTSTKNGGPADGRVWTDKSVSAIKSSDKLTGSFNVTLSAMAQEYIMSAEEIANLDTTAAADVLFILDFSSSMKDHTYANQMVQVEESKASQYTTKQKIDGKWYIRRFEAMIEAVNLAVQQIMTANKNNRIMICWYAGSYGNAVDLGSYCVKSGGKEVTNVNFFQLGTENNSYQFKTVSGFAYVGGSEKSYSTNISSGTLSQKGIAGCVENFIKQAKASESAFDKQRTPFVLYMTDGFATKAGTNFTAQASKLNTDLSGDGSTHTDYKVGDQQVAAATILTAAYQKDQIISTYNTLNTNKGHAGVTDFEWYNVGIGTDGNYTASNPMMSLHVMLNPSLVQNSGEDTQRAVYNYMASYSKDTDYDITKNSKYLYTQNDFVTYASTGDVINGAFTKLGEAVARLTGATYIPITKTTSSAESDIFITFTDNIGSGMNVDKTSFKLSLNGTTYTGAADSEGKVTFTNKVGDVTTTLLSYAKISGSKILYYINSKELSIVKFASRMNPGTAYDYDNDGTAEVYQEESVVPIRMSFTVTPSTDAIAAATKTAPYLYSNAFDETANATAGSATAVFIPTKSNEYYYTDEGTAKTAETAVNKASGANKTETASTSSSFSWGTDKVSYINNLGNNGRIQVLARVNITGNPEEQAPGGPVEYTVTATNLTDNPVTADLNIVLNGVTLDAEQSSEWKNQTIPVDNSGEKWEKTVKTHVKSDAEVGTKYTQTANISVNDSAYATTILTAVQGIDVTVNTKLDDSGKSISEITGDTALYLKDADGTYYQLINTPGDLSKWTASVPAGEYTIVNGNTSGATEYGTVTFGDTSKETSVNWYTIEYEFVNAPDGVSSLLPSATTVLSGTKYDAAGTSSIKKDGYTFAGWYTDEGCTKAYTDGSALSAHTDLYGCWKAVPDFTVTKGVTLNGKTASKADGKVNVGDTVTYSVVVTNNHAEAAMVVDLVDDVPEGLTDITDISNQGSYSAETGKITWTSVSVPKNSSVTLTFNATVPDAAANAKEYTNTAFITKAGQSEDGKEDYTGPGSEENNPGTVDFTAVARTNIAIMKAWSDNWSSHTGESIYVNIYTNDTVYETVTFDSTNGNKLITRSLPTVDDAGKDITYTIFEVKSDKTTKLNEGDALSSEGTLKNYKVSYSQKTEGGITTHIINNNYVVQPSDITLGKAVTKTTTEGVEDAKTAKAGDTLTYTLTVKNNRAHESAANVIVEDTLSEGLVFVSSDITDERKTAGESFVQNGQKCTWTVGTLAAGATATLKISVKIPEGVNIKEYTNQSRLVGLDGKEVSGDNQPKSPQVTTEVRSLKVTKTWYSADGTQITDTSKMPEVTIVLNKNQDGAYRKCTLKYDASAEDKGWSYTFDNLPVNDEHGEITYTVSEVSGEGFTSERTYTDAGVNQYVAATFKNTRKVNVTYEWVGNAPEGAKLPASEILESKAKYTASKDYGSSAGYKFSGWYTDKDFAAEHAYTDGSELTADITLYGKWIPVSNYTVSKEVKFNGEDAEEVYSNHTVTYYVTVTNENPAATMTAEVVDVVPEGLTVVENSISDNGAYESGRITWSMELTAGESRKVSFNATIPATLSEITEFENVAYVSKSNGEDYKPDPEIPGPGDPENPATVSFTGVPVKVITISKDWSDKWENHTDESAIINVYANGTKLESVTLDSDEAQVLYVDAVDDKGEPVEYTYREVSVNDPLSDVAQGEMNGLYKFTFSESSDPAVPTANVTVKVNNEYQIRTDDFEFNKTADGQARAGETFAYTLTVKNNRAYETAANVVVEDILPAGLTFISAEKSSDDIVEQDVDNPQKITWTIASIAPGTTATLSITVSVPADETAAEYLNTGSIKSIGETECPEPKKSQEVKTTVRNFTVNKVWHGSDGNPIADTANLPEVDVSLYQNGEKYGDSVKLTHNSWSYTWELLPLYDSAGTAYTYTVAEESVEGFTGAVEYSAESRSEKYGDTAADIINTLKTVTVRYEFKGSDQPEGAVLPENEIKDYGTAYTSANLPETVDAPFKYYEIEGWYIDETCETPFVDGTILNDELAPDGAVTLYGKWTRKEVKVTVVKPEMGPDVTYPDPWKVKQGEKADPKTLADPNEEYIFEGYYTDPDFKTPFENVILDDSIASTEELKLYPKWTKKPVVTYVYTGDVPKGLEAPAEEKLMPGAKYTAKTATGTVENYVFEGWFTDEACTKKFVDGTEIKGDVKLYGKWTLVIPKTGDNLGASMWLGVALLAMLAGVTGLVKRPRFGSKGK